MHPVLKKILDPPLTLALRKPCYSRADTLIIQEAVESPVKLTDVRLKQAPGIRTLSLAVTNIRTLLKLPIAQFERHLLTFRHQFKRFHLFLQMCIYGIPHHSISQGSLILVAPRYYGLSPVRVLTEGLKVAAITGVD